MKRTFIRLCGVFVAFFASVFNSASAATTPLEKWDCVNFGPEVYDNYNYVVYRIANCQDPESEIDACISGFISHDLMLQYSDCSSGSEKIHSFSGLAPNGIECENGFCNNTGLFCSNYDFFRFGWYCSTPSETGTGFNCSIYSGDICPELLSYKTFSRCIDGNYESEQMFPPAVLNSGSGQFSGYCYPCSGFKLDESGNEVTFGVTGTNSSGQFYWLATSGEYGPTACRGYMSGNMTNSRGTFTLPQGCEYNDNATEVPAEPVG